MSITSKLPNVGLTIFSQMSQLAMAHNAINLSQGFPDFDIDPLLLEKVNYYHAQGLHQYAPMAGIPKLRAKIAAIYKADYQAEYCPDSDVLITNGASEAIFSAIAALMAHGDEAIIFEPAYDLYRPALELFGGVVKPIKTYAPDFSIDWDEVAATITGKTKLIIINNPNNPTGKMWRAQDFDALQQLVQQHNLWVISDEVYGRIVMSDNASFKSVCEYQILKQRSIITASFGKLLHATGWKIGYCLAPDFLMNEIKKVHQFNVFAVNHALQYAIADYLEDPKVYTQLSEYFKPRYELLIKGLEYLGFEVVPADGTYFVVAKYSQLSNLDDVSFVKYLIEEFGVATIPVSAFYSDKHDGHLLRFCFAKKIETLAQALKQLERIKAI